MIVILAKPKANYAQLRTVEHAFDRESAVYRHITNSTYYGCIQNLFHFNYDSFNKTLILIQSKVTPK